jgi:hypothetical protein
MKQQFKLLLIAALGFGTVPAEAASGTDVAIGVVSGIILGSVLNRHSAPPPPVYYQTPPVILAPPVVVYPPAVVYTPPMPCYNKPVPMVDQWGRHIGWREIRVCN